MSYAYVIRWERDIDDQQQQRILEYVEQHSMFYYVVQTNDCVNAIRFALDYYKTPSSFLGRFRDRQQNMVSCLTCTRIAIDNFFETDGVISQGSMYVLDSDNDVD